MYEVKDRVGTARSGMLSGDGWQFETPGIDFMDTGRFPAPVNAHPIPDRGEVRTLNKSIELYQNPKIFLEEFINFREQIGHQAPLHLPGTALPHNLALLVYLGADILDSSRAALLSSEGFFLTSDGALPADEVGQDECGCRGCGESLYHHNMLALQTELGRVRGHISRGTLREFVEYRAKTSPRLVEVLRLFDTLHYDFQEKRCPVKGQNFRAITRLSLHRPDIERFRRRIIQRYRKPPNPQTLVLLPCSAKKPYSDSSSHYYFRNAIRNSGRAVDVHEVILTSPLGLVPRELELFYPAQNYDIPVTGRWFEDEKHMINNLLKEYLEINNYNNIINHTGMDFLPVEAVSTVEGSPRSDASLKNLTDALAELPDTENRWNERSVQEFNSMALFQFGPDAEGMFEGANVRGRYPKLRIFRGKEQLASLSYVTGQLVPTLEGSQFLVEKGIHTVKIADFEIQGNIFAVGVEDADSRIRPGDEVAVIRNGELAACGTATMGGEEMVQSDRGEAVRVRHRVK